jgi:hypothetical protein
LDNKRKATLAHFTEMRLCALRVLLFFYLFLKPLLNNLSFIDTTIIILISAILISLLSLSALLSFLLISDAQITTLYYSASYIFCKSNLRAWIKYVIYLNKMREVILNNATIATICNMSGM